MFAMLNQLWSTFATFLRGTEQFMAAYEQVGIVTNETAGAWADTSRAERTAKQELAQAQLNKLRARTQATTAALPAPAKKPAPKRKVTK